MNTQDDSSQYLKQKRDEYIVEIRKKKNNDHIRAKRTKFGFYPSDPNEGEQKAPLPPLTELAPAFIENCKAGNLFALPIIGEQIRRIISVDDNPPVTELIQTGVVPYILDLLTPSLYHEEKLMIECSWIINNIASKDLEHVDYLVGFPTLQIAMDLLDHPSQDVKENALYILANIAGESLEYRDKLIEGRLVFKIDALLEAKAIDPKFFTLVSWLMSNMCRGKPYPEFYELIPFLKYLEDFIKYSQEEEIIINSIWSLAYLTDGEQEEIQEILNLEILDEILKLFRTNNDHLKAPLLRLVGNILTGTDTQTDMLVSRNIIEVLYPLLYDEKKVIRKEAVWAYSNLLGGSEAQVHQVFAFQGGKIIDTILLLIQKDEQHVAEEGIHALANAVDGGSIEVVKDLVNRGFMDIVVETLQTNTQAKILKPCLGAIDNMLQAGEELKMGPTIDDNPFYIKLLECDGLKQVERLQNYANKNVTRLVESIFKTIDGTRNQNEENGEM